MKNSKRHVVVVILLTLSTLASTGCTQVAQNSPFQGGGGQQQGFQPALGGLASGGQNPQSPAASAPLTGSPLQAGFAPAQPGAIPGGPAIAGAPGGAPGPAASGDAGKQSGPGGSGEQLQPGYGPGSSSSAGSNPIAAPASGADGRPRELAAVPTAATPAWGQSVIQ